MVTAATRLAAVQELLLLVAQHTFYSGYMDALRAMRLVSRVFYAAATPYHFMELRIDSTLLGEGEMEKRLTAPLELVRHLYLDRYKNWPGQEERLRRVLSSVPRLERFRYVLVVIMRLHTGFHNHNTTPSPSRARSCPARSWRRVTPAAMSRKDDRI